MAGSLFYPESTEGMAGASSLAGDVLGLVGNYLGDDIKRNLALGGAFLGRALENDPLLNPVIEADFGSQPIDLRVDRMYGEPQGLLTSPQEPQYQRVGDAQGVLNFVANEAMTPANYIGGGLIKAGNKVINAITDPNAARGMILSSLDNFIPGFYSGSQALATAKWTPENLIRTVRDLASPQSRALYKEAGMTRGGQDLMAAAAEEGNIHNGVAIAQYMTRIAAQAGREGEVADALLKIENLSDFVPAQVYQVGDYRQAIKEKDLLPRSVNPTTGNTRRINVTDNELNIIEQHFGRVWTEPNVSGANVGFADTAQQGNNARLVIKAPSGTTGQHFNDVLYSASYVAPLKKLFRDRTNVPYDELVDGLRTAADKNTNARMPFHVIDSLSSPENGVWITGSRPGSAVTEGGINLLVNVRPDGRMLGVMSDEHNLYEQLAQRIQSKTKLPTLDIMKRVIPNRLVAVTPPMVTNVRTLDRARSTARGVQSTTSAPNPNYDRKQTETWRSILEDAVAVNPSSEAIAAEEARQAGAGMLVGSAVATNNRE